MIVDDEIMSQDILSKYIETQLPSYQITAICKNGQEALETFKTSPADILLVDIRMPVMDGLTLIEELNKISNNYVPIIISSYGEFDYAKTAMRLGVVHYLLKPLDFSELNHCLEAASQSLRFQRVAHSSLTLRDDDQELYLMDILTGQYSEMPDAQQQFEKLAFPFSYDDCSGICIKITFAHTDRWIYGRDSLFTAVNNLIHLIYAPNFLLPLFRKSSSCDYLIIDENCADFSFDELLQQAKQLLGAEISLKVLFAFTSIEELRTGDYIQRQSRLPKANDMLSDEAEDTALIHSTIQKAIAYMEEHYAEDLTREDVAAKVYMSGAHFSRSFKMVTQTTYKDYLTEIRMQKAIELLKTNAKVQEVAQQVGYPNPNRFNINFRHYTSYTPSEYRTNVLKMI